MMRLSRKAVIAFAVLLTMGLGTASIATADEDGTGFTSDRGPEFFDTSDDRIAAGRANDNIGNAHVFAHRGGRFFDDNINATLQTDWNGIREPAYPNGNPGGSSIWYKLTPCRTGWVEFNTFGSHPVGGGQTPLDTMLAVYRGQQLRQLRLVANGPQGGFNDDVGRHGAHISFTSFVRVHLVRGRTYHIVVDGFNNTGLVDGAAQGRVRINAQVERPCLPGGAGPNR